MPIRYLRTYTYLPSYFFRFRITPEELRYSQAKKECEPLMADTCNSAATLATYEQAILLSEEGYFDDTETEVRVAGRWINDAWVNDVNDEPSKCVHACRRQLAAETRFLNILLGTS